MTCVVAGKHVHEFYRLPRPVVTTGCARLWQLWVAQAVQASPVDSRNRSWALDSVARLSMGLAERRGGLSLWQLRKSAGAPVQVSLHGFPVCC